MLAETIGDRHLVRDLTNARSFDRAQRPALKLAVVWVAIFGLYLHLLAAALCTGGSGLDPAGATPICHAESGHPASHGDHGRTPAPCPFCAAHAHVAALSTPTPTAVARIALAVLVVAPSPARTLRVPRRLASASPRGPPAA